MVSLLSPYSSLGSAIVLLRYVCQEPKEFAVYWGNVLVTVLALGSLFTGVLVWIGPHIASSYSPGFVLCVAIGDCFCTQLTQAAGRVFQTFEKMRVTAILNLLTNLLRLTTAAMMIAFLHHATARQWVMAALGVSIVAAVMAVATVTRAYGRPAFSPSLLLKRAGEGLAFALSYSTSGICDNIDKTMLGHYGMNAANGIYSMAYRAIDAATIPLSAVQGAAIPRFFRKGSEGAQSTAAYALRIVKRTAPLTLLIAAVLWLAAPAIPHLVGKGFAESVLALRWLCLLPLFRSFHFGAGDALNGAGCIKLRLSGLILAAVFNFAVNLYLIPHYGWQGAAWSSLATDGLLAVFNWTALLAIR